VHQGQLELKLRTVGGITAGQRVSGTIKNGMLDRSSQAFTDDRAGIIKNSIFEGNAGVQLMAFTVAISVSATWLMIATKKGWPVSTTYSLISSLIGVGVATGGSPAVNWVSRTRSALSSASFQPLGLEQR
jgi:sodium-dependent phosphate transporter